MTKQVKVEVNKNASAALYTVRVDDVAIDTVHTEREAVICAQVILDALDAAGIEWEYANNAE